METILPYIQIALSVFLVAVVLLQQTEAGLGGAFGGADSAGGQRTRRGSERILFYTTVLLAILFALSAIASLVI